MYSVNGIVKNHDALTARLSMSSSGMMDKAMTVKRDKLGPPFGRMDADTLVEVERCLAVFLGIAK